MSDKPNCYKCKWSQSIPGDAHKTCLNTAANVKGHQIGIKQGYFMHPYNFDPVWLLSCDGYEERVVE